MRPGEELDAAAVDAWLKERVQGLAGSPEVTQFSGGASNWTYRLRYPEHDLVLRRPPSGTKAKSAHDMSREVLVQRALRPFLPCVPEVVAACEDGSVLGVPFYVMRRIPGVIVRRNLPDGMTLAPEQARRLGEALLDRLVALHRVDPAAAGLSSLGKGPGYPRRQVEGWSDRYGKARTWNVPSFRKVIAWLKERTPEDAGACVIHNDFRLDNLVLDPEDPARVVGILDWEMATVGDPLMDLGCSLAYWVEADDDPVARFTRRQPTDLPGMPSRRGLVEGYFARFGIRSRDFTFYEVFGLFRLAVIAQQIYYRYHHGQTRNPAFRTFWVVVRYLEWRCRRLIARSARAPSAPGR